MSQKANHRLAHKNKKKQKKMHILQNNAAGVVRLPNPDMNGSATAGDQSWGICMFEEKHIRQLRKH